MSAPPAEAPAADGVPATPPRTPSTPAPRDAAATPGSLPRDWPALTTAGTPPAGASPAERIKWASERLQLWAEARVNPECDELYARDLALAATVALRGVAAATAAAHVAAAAHAAAAESHRHMSEHKTEAAGICAQHARAARAHARAALESDAEQPAARLVAARLCLSETPPQQRAALRLLSRCGADCADVALPAVLRSAACASEAAALLKSSDLRKKLEELYSCSPADKLLKQHNGKKPPSPADCTSPVTFLGQPATHWLDGYTPGLEKAAPRSGMSVLELADLPGPFTEHRFEVAVARSRELKARLGSEPAGWPSVADGDCEQAAAPPNLVVAFWNIRVSLGFHKISSCLANKAASVATLLAETSASLLVLQECPLAKKHAATWQQALRAKLETHWIYASAPTGGEAAGFLYDSRFMTPLVKPRVYGRDDWPPRAKAAKKVRRPPALAVFRLMARAPVLASSEAPPPAVLTVLSVHLKSSEPDTAKAQLRLLGGAVLAWAVEQAAQVAPPNPGEARPMIVGGDFNLDGSLDTMRSDGGQTYAADAWQPLRSKGLVPLLPANTVTNAGPPVSEHDQCYDHVLARGVGECSAAAAVHVAMQHKQADAKALLVALTGCEVSTPEYCKMRASFCDAIKKSIKDEVYTTWSDHWPVVAPMRIAWPATGLPC